MPENVRGQGRSRHVERSRTYVDSQHIHQRGHSTKAQELTSSDPCTNNKAPGQCPP